MSTCVFGSPIFSDSSVLYTPTFSGGSWAATLPLTNLADRRLGKVARSSSAAKDDTLFTADLKTDRPVRLVGIPKHTMSSAGRWRVVGLPSTSLFNYEVGDNLTAKGATFSRGSTATYVDANGVVQTASSGTARDSHYINGVRHLLLEASSTNAILYSRDLTQTAWHQLNATVAKDQTGADGVANSACSITATSSPGSAYQDLTTSAGTRTFSLYAKRVTGTGTVRVSINGGSSYTVLALTSAWQRFTVTGSMTAVHELVIELGTSGDKIAVDFTQDEPGAVATSPIVTTSGSVTRSADSLYFTYTPVPQAMTVYTKHTEIGTSRISGASLWEIGNAAPWLVAFNAGSNVYRISHNNGSATVTVDPAASPAIGDTVEFRALLNANGSIQAGQSLNSGTEATTSTSSANTLAGAWSATRFYPNGGAVASAGVAAFRSIRIATGSSNSLTTMQGLVYDSGWLTPWPGSLTAEDLAKPDGTSLNVLAYTQVPSTATNARYWTVQFDDTANTAGYIDVARLCITGAFTPSVNMDDGDRIGYESDTIRTVTPGGAALYDVRASRRTQEFSIDNLLQAESLATIRQLQQQLGLSGQFLWIRDPAETTYGYQQNFLGTFRQLGPLESTSTRYKTTFSVTEEL